MEQLGFEGMPRRLYTCTPTRLSSWLDCPRRYRMTYLDRPAPPKGPPWAHNSLGASIIHAPGHTAGSVCLYCEDLGAVFTGHVLLAEGPAPQDGEFPDFAGQLNAIGECLLPLPADTRVLPGHGPETTIAAAEKKFDSWVAGQGSGPVLGG